MRDWESLKLAFFNHGDTEDTQRTQLLAYANYFLSETKNTETWINIRSFGILFCRRQNNTYNEKKQ